MDFSVPRCWCALDADGRGPTPTFDHDASRQHTLRTKQFALQVPTKQTEEKSSRIRVLNPLIQRYCHAHQRHRGGGGVG